MADGNLHIGEDNLIRWDGMELASTPGSYVISGTVTFALKSKAGVSLATGSLSNVSGFNGRWQGTIASTDLTSAILIENETYILEVTASNGSGADGFRRLELTAVYHRVR
jgi:hypothetical protein